MNPEFLSELGIEGENAEAIIAKVNDEISQIRLTHSIENELKQRGAKNINAAMKLFDQEGLKFSDGKVEGLSERMAEFEKENDFLFSADIPKTVFTAPVESGTGDSISREDFAKMGYSKRLKLFNEQPEVYKRLNEKI